MKLHHHQRHLLRNVTTVIKEEPITETLIKYLHVVPITTNIVIVRLTSGMVDTLRLRLSGIEGTMGSVVVLLIEGLLIAFYCLT